MRNISKKAQSIYHDTYMTLDHYVRSGKQFDSLSNVVCTSMQTITKSTIADLEMLCKMEFHKAERAVKWHGANHPTVVAREVEVARRMWLTIQNASREVDEWGSSVTS